MRVCMRVSSYDVSVAFTAFVFLSLHVPYLLLLNPADELLMLSA